MSLQAFRPAMSKFRKCSCKNKHLTGVLSSLSGKNKLSGRQNMSSGQKNGKIFNDYAQGLRHIHHEDVAANESGTRPQWNGSGQEEPSRSHL